MSETRRKPGALGLFVDGYRAWLLERGYSPFTVTESLISLGHLGRWMAREGIDLDQLDEVAVRAFVDTQARTRAGRLPLASVAPLLHYLRAAGIVPAEASVQCGWLDRLIEGYEEWLLIDRGLAEVTVCSRTRLARRFLSKLSATCVGDGIGEITSLDVTGFLLGECDRVSRASAACAATRLRSLLRYLAVRGQADPGVADAVPKVARWRDSRIPQFPTPTMIDRLLASCDQSSVHGARDYAILLLLARLGLRTIEVSRLRLADLDWRAGEITIDGKAHQRERLPLPSDVGEALVGYLRTRDTSVERRVFVTVRAPIRALEVTGVRSAVHHAYRRAGLKPVAAHQLRHALASDLVREGASLVAVGQILRHKHLESTGIYAKVDLERLRLAARPWPEAVR